MIADAILSIVPTIILYFILQNTSGWLGNDLYAVKDENIKESIFYSFCISFIGFNIITSVISTFIHIDQPNLIRTPIMYIYAVLFSPIFEELICRKLIQVNLNKYMNIYLTIMITAILFASLHFSLTGFLGYVFVGIVWGWYYRKSKNILVPIASHFLFNYITLLIQSVKG